MTLTRQAVVRRRLSVISAVTVTAVAALYLPVTLLAPVAPASAVVESFQAPVIDPAELAFPGYGASAVGAIGFDGPGPYDESDAGSAVLAVGGSDQALPIASISKVVTALVVLEAKPLALGESGPTITFTEADLALYGKYLRVNGQVSPMALGGSLTQRQMLEVVLLSSANNYTETLAGWAFGSQAAFVDAAAVWLDAGGFTSTTIVEPTGISPGNVGSATDLVGIGRLAIADPVIAEIVASASVDVPQLGTLSNTNKLLGIDGIDGIKTGTLDEAGSCLLFSADIAVGEQTVTVVGVVLGGPDRETIDAAIRELLVDVVDGFREVTLAEPGDPFATYTTDWDQTAQAVAAEGASVLVWSDTPISADVVTADIGESAEGEPAGTVTFSVGELSIQVPLVTDAAVEGPNSWWRISHPLELLP